MCRTLNGRRYWSIYAMLGSNERLHCCTWTLLAAVSVPLARLAFNHVNLNSPLKRTVRRLTSVIADFFRCNFPVHLLFIDGFFVPGMDTFVWRRIDQHQPMWIYVHNCICMFTVKQTYQAFIKWAEWTPALAVQHSKHNRIYYYCYTWQNYSFLT